MNLKKIWKCTLLVAFLFGLHSCSKKTENDITASGNVRLIFQNAQIIENQIINKNASQGATNEISTTIQSTTAVAPAQSGTGFIAEAYAEQTTIEDANSRSLQQETNNSNGIIRKSASTKSMTLNYTYRVIIYNKETNKLFQTFLAKSGKSFEIDVPKGANLKWYAYSYNDDQDIPEPTDIDNPMIETSINKDFLYDTGDIEVKLTKLGVNDTYPIKINFKHQVTQVKISLNASSISQVSNIEVLKASFAKSDYLKKGVFSIKDGTISNSEVVTTDVIFNNIASESGISEKAYYTTDPSSVSEFQVNIEELTVNFYLASSTNSRVNIATYDPSKQIIFKYKFGSPTIGNSVNGIIQLNYELQPRRIFHLSNNTHYAYSLERGPSWKMINDLRNFGNLPNSLVKMRPYQTGQGVWIGGSATDDLKNWGEANTDNGKLLTALKDKDNKPDIIITGYAQSTFNVELQDSIVSFINKGGVYIMMNESTSDNVKSLINKIFDMPTTGITLRSLTNSGSMYPLLQTEKNDRVLNGPFGDARGKLWGEDASTTVGVLGLPTNSAIIYSYGQAVNRIDNEINAQTVSMFKHSTKNFFYLGDGGLVSYNGGIDPSICPFDYNPDTARPIPKKYGNLNTAKGYAARSQDAYNGIIAGNIMLWAAAIAEFNGLRPWKFAR